MEEPSQKQPAQNPGGRNRNKRPSEDDTSASGSAAKKVKGKPGQGLKISQRLQAVVEPIYERGYKKIPLKDEFADLRGAVNEEGVWSDELFEIIDLYMTKQRTTPVRKKGESLSLPLLLKRAGEHECHLEHRERLIKLKEKIFQTDDNKEIADLVARNIHRVSQSLKSSCTKSGNEQLALLKSQPNPDDQKLQEIAKIQAFMEGKRFHKEQKTLSDILDGIDERCVDWSRPVPLRADLEAFIAHIKGEHEDRWGDRLMEIVKFHTTTPDRLTLEPYDAVLRWTTLAKHFRAQSVALSDLSKRLTHKDNKLIVDPVKQYVDRRVNYFRRYARDKCKEHNVVGVMQQKLDSSTSPPEHTLEKEYRELDDINFFIKPRRENSALTKSLDQLERFESDIDGNLMSREYETSPEKLEAIKSETLELVKKYNNLCQKIKKDYEQETKEFKYLLEGKDFPALWQSN